MYIFVLIIFYKSLKFSTIYKIKEFLSRTKPKNQIYIYRGIRACNKQQKKIKKNVNCKLNKLLLNPSS